MLELDYQDRGIWGELLKGTQDLGPRDVLSQFERYWFSGLGLTPYSWPSSLRPHGEGFEGLVTQRFNPAFLEVDASYASSAIAWDVLQALPERVSQDLFTQGPAAIREFCLDVVPVVERAYPEMREEYQEALAHLLISANICAYSIVLDQFGQKPLTNGARNNLQLEIGKFLHDREVEKKDGVVYITKRPIKLGVDPHLVLDLSE